MRYKVGWFIPQEILALTHLVPEVSQEDFVGIMQEMQDRLKEVNQPFHLIIDNRIIQNEQVVGLEEILRSSPQLEALPLAYIVMVLPYIVQEKAATREMQKVGNIHLKYVDTIEAAFDAFKAVDENLQWEQQVDDFFAKDIV